MTHSKDKLASALRTVGLDGMAALAEQGYYHDFLSPLDLPTITLVENLAQTVKDNPSKRDAILALRARVIDGEFDSTEAESDAWAASPDGQATFARLLRGE